MGPRLRGDERMEKQPFSVRPTLYRNEGRTHG
ncbi:MAG: hypothetical protein JWR59_164, partial [Brevundimonas sp.]|nr:hypothetical protein [Brevundimonas sp.]